MTNTTSEFGRELDSLADIISFGIAPAILAYTWGVQFVAFAGPGVARSVPARRARFSRFSFWCAGRPASRASTSRRTRSREIRASRIASILSACRFRRRRAWWRR